MIETKRTYNVELAGGMLVKRLSEPLALYDDHADVFILHINGVSLPATAKVEGNVIRADGQTRTVKGTVENGDAVVTLTAPCYAVTGVIVLTVTITLDGVIHSLLRVVASVVAGKTDGSASDDSAGSGGSGGGLPTGGGAYQQLVTDGDGNALWEDRLAYSYTDMVEILPETTVPISGDENPVTEQFSAHPVVGNEYTFTYNGIEYKCIAQPFEMDGITCPAFGDVGLLTGGTSTGEPFALLVLPPDVAAGFGATAILVPLDGATSVTIKIVGSGEVVKPIDYKYLPSYIYGIETVEPIKLLDNVELSGSGTMSIATPFAAAPVVDQAYKVTWNGVEYTCTAIAGENGVVLLGNPTMSMDAGTGEPFCIAYAPPGTLDGAYGLVYVFDGSTSATLTVQHSGEIVHKVPERFLPPTDLSGVVTNLLNGSASGSVRSINSQEEGAYSYKMGKNAFAFGTLNTRASADCAIAMGNGAQADESSAVSIGPGTRSSAERAVSIGADAEASAYDAVAFVGGKAKAAKSYARGEGVVASGKKQTAIGRYNVEDADSKYILIIGNGTGYDNSDTVEDRSNAHTLDWNGNAWYRGRVYVGGTSQEDADYLVTRTELESAVGSGNVIPSYWLTHLNERIPAIRAAMTAAGWKKSAFLWYHDVHWTYGYKRAPMLLKYLYEHTPINKTMFGGDVVDNEGDTSTMAYLWDWRDAVRDIPNHHSVPGNHDDGNSTDNRWDDPYIYAYLLAAEETPDVVRGDAGLYYYIDDPTEKTRYLYIDTATKDGNIINDTAEQAWLKESLKSTPAGWHIVAIAHIWRTVDYDASPPADAGWSYGGAYCIGEFDKYNARTGEYASCTGKVEFCIGGHTHVDADFVSDGGIPVILTECDSRYVRSGLECTEGTITESSVNAIVADYANGIVNVIRIGRGSSRTVNLDGSGSSGGETPDVPDVPTGDFTNTLTEAGFSEGMRFSNTSLTDVEAAGWDITGYIPATRGDVIRMANVNFLDLDGTGGTSRAMIYLFDANKTYITCSANYDPNNLMSDAWSAVYGDDGDVVQFTIPTSYSSTGAYIRIGARNIDQYSVITVNEPIE